MSDTRCKACFDNSPVTPIERAWIWFWYNDATRLLMLIGVPVVPVVALCAVVFGPGEYLRAVALATYGGLVGWALVDNDYSKLRKIGRDEYRRKMTCHRCEVKQ